MSSRRADLRGGQASGIVASSGIAAVRKTNWCNQLKLLGFGTMNSKDGKPFKTRQGGVMRLENLIKDTQDEMYKKIKEGRDMEDAEAKKGSGRGSLCPGNRVISAIRHTGLYFDINHFVKGEQ